MTEWTAWNKGYWKLGRNGRRIIKVFVLVAVVVVAVVVAAAAVVPQWW